MNAVQIVRRLFALPDRPAEPAPIPPEAIEEAMPRAGEIVFIGGGSGGGKSRLLTAIRDKVDPHFWIEPGRLPMPDLPVVDIVCQALEGDGPEQSRVEAALELLSRVGLAEAWTYLQRPYELSDGQRWRLRLALAVARALRLQPKTPNAPVTATIAIDEFAAVLDRITARIVARALRRLVDRPGSPRLSAVVATSHDDLRLALCPDRTVVADFGKYFTGQVAIKINRYRKRRRMDELRSTRR
jgi:ABC-type ATPase with predicted acetyltransferase domain